MAETRDLVGAIDLGGTKIYSAVLDADGSILGEDLRLTEAAEGRDAVIARLIASQRAALAAAKAQKRDLRAIGVAAPGPVDWRTGHVIDPPNLPGWGDIALGPILSNRLDRPVVLENDANAAALGEFVQGAGRGAESLIYITLSTGIGGGLVLSGHLYRGVSGTAGEVGHMIVRPGGPLCGCGKRGCLEALASGSAIGREGAAAAELGRAPILRRLAAESGQPVTAALVALAAAEGDPDAQAILDEAAMALGIGLGNLVNLLNPDVIVVGGGAAHIGAPLLEPAERIMRQVAFPGPAARVQVRTAELEYAATHGIAALARQLPQ